MRFWYTVYLPYTVGFVFAPLHARLYAGEKEEKKKKKRGEEEEGGEEREWELRIPSAFFST